MIDELNEPFDVLGKHHLKVLPTEEQISERAFQLYWDRRVPREKDDWHDAVKQLIDELNPHGHHGDDEDEQ